MLSEHHDYSYISFRNHRRALLSYNLIVHTLYLQKNHWCWTDVWEICGIPKEVFSHNNIDLEIMCKAL